MTQNPWYTRYCNIIVIKGLCCEIGYICHVSELNVSHVMQFFGAKSEIGTYVCMLSMYFLRALFVKQIWQDIKLLNKIGIYLCKLVTVHYLFICVYLKNDSSFACPYLDQKKLSRSSQEYINSSIIISLIKPLGTALSICWLLFNRTSSSL